MSLNYPMLKTQFAGPHVAIMILRTQCAPPPPQNATCRRKAWRHKSQSQFSSDNCLGHTFQDAIAFTTQNPSTNSKLNSNYSQIKMFQLNKFSTKSQQNNSQQYLLYKHFIDTNFQASKSQTQWLTWHYSWPGQAHHPGKQLTIASQKGSLENVNHVLHVV